MYYGENFESARGFIEKFEEYIHYDNKNINQIKRNEPVHPARR